jgi:hypothetical protein
MAQTWWIVRLNGKKIDSIPCDKDISKETILQGLVEHDGYDPNITISKERAKKPKKEKQVWEPIADDKVRHIWAKPDGTGEVAIDPGYYSESGTPVVNSEDEQFGDQDMIYVRTEIRTK